MGSFINSITSPIGVKLFSGGPYPDNGKTDQLAKNAQDFQAQLQPIIAAIAQAAGINMGGGTVPAAQQPDPYSLSPLQQGEVNQQASIDREARDKILSTVKAHLSSAGFTDSSTMTAAEAYLDSQLAGQQGAERVQAGENAYQNRMSGLAQIAQLFSQGFGATQQATGAQAQQATTAHANAMNQLGAALALAGSMGAFGKGFPGYGSGAPSPYMPPGQAGAQAGGAAGGGAGAGAASGAIPAMPNFAAIPNIYAGL